MTVSYVKNVIIKYYTRVSMLPSTKREKLYVMRGRKV